MYNLNSKRGKLIKHTYEWSNDNLLKFQLKFVEEETYRNDVVFDQAGLILYFTTQSNITSAITEKKLIYDEVETLLRGELRKYFLRKSTKRTLSYGNVIRYLKRI